MPRSLVSLLTAVPIAMLGGLIGLGGAEFRLPVLVAILHYPARQAVPLNLAVSLITVAVALAIRANSLPTNALAEVSLPIIALVSGAVPSAIVGASWAARISERQLRRVITLLLAAIGCLLVLDAFLPTAAPALVPSRAVLQTVVGVMFGAIIGLVSSLLGVAGGELIIPTLVFMFGADIKTAGTASLIISLPTVGVGIVRYALAGAYRMPADWREVIVPMGLGSVLGALAGAALAEYVPAAWLKLSLGCILFVSAARMPRHSATESTAQPADHSRM